MVFMQTSSVMPACSPFARFTKLQQQKVLDVVQPLLLADALRSQSRKVWSASAMRRGGTAPRGLSPVRGRSELPPPWRLSYRCFGPKSGLRHRDAEDSKAKSWGRRWWRRLRGGKREALGEFDERSRYRFRRIGASASIWCKQRVRACATGRVRSRPRWREWPAADG